MPITNISNLFTPAIWARATREQMAIMPSIINSPVVVRGGEFDTRASGAGVSVNMPLWTDQSEQDDEIQVENTAPTVNNLSTVTQVAPVLNRVFNRAASALSAQISGEDPVGEIGATFAAIELKQRQKTLVATLRGVCGTFGALSAAAALSATRTEAFIEAGNSATSTELMDVNKFINTVGLMGELAGQLQNGAVLCHSSIYTALQRLDAASFKSGVVSDLPFAITTYRNIPIYVSDALVRAGTTNGFVYDTYIIAPGRIAWGEKAKSVSPSETNIDVAAMQMYSDIPKNDVYFYDRSRFLMFPNGVAWTGTPAGQSATNTELRTATNWALRFQSANRTGIVSIRTNG